VLANATGTASKEAKGLYRFSEKFIRRAKDVDVMVIAAPDHWHGFQLSLPWPWEAEETRICGKPSVAITLMRVKILVQAAKKYGKG